ncbi:MAG: NAD-dependent protein deacylase [Candidatus Atribacteria bacterium]|nr:NAD-dependent protein deacylase [Candidatus Atribacteria bacterium]
MLQEIKKKAIAEYFWMNRPWVILTGAGISTESGIPDFRSPHTGLWKQYDPMEILSTDVLFNKPELFYQIGFSILMKFKHAQPNQAHCILASWESRGLVKAIITQNIDSLHIDAGSKKVLEIHGHLRTAHCMKCLRTVSIEKLESLVNGGQIPPHCSCGGIIRPDVVLFGDMLPSSFEEAIKMVQNSPLLVIGSSLQVSPANLIPSLAKKLIIVNLDETPFDNRAAFVLHGKAGMLLNFLDEEVKKIAERV